jgi:hypothetical protein
MKRLLFGFLITFFLTFFFVSGFILAVNFAQLLHTFVDNSYIPIDDFEFVAYFVNYAWLPNIVVITLISLIAAAISSGISMRILQQWSWGILWKLGLVGLVLVLLFGVLFSAVRPYNGVQCSAELPISLEGLKQNHLLLGDHAFLYYRTLDNQDPNQILLRDVVYLKFFPFDETGYQPLGFGIYREGLVATRLNPNQYSIYLEHTLFETPYGFNQARPIWEIPKTKIFTPFVLHPIFFPNLLNQSFGVDSVLWIILLYGVLILFGFTLGYITTLTRIRLLDLLTTSTIYLIGLFIINMIGLRIAETIRMAAPNTLLDSLYEYLIMVLALAVIGGACLFGIQLVRKRQQYSESKVESA